MAKPFFSIIIPTLNEEKFVPKLLGDLKKQKFKDFEVIHVDGDSEDKTVEKVKQYSSAFPLTILEHNKRNVSFQRNSGGKKAIGDYLIFLDADSRVTTYFTQQLHSNIIKKRGLLFLPYVFPEEKKPEVVAFYQVINYLVEVSQNVGKPFPSVGVMIIERNFFNRIGGYNEEVFVYEDQEILQNAQKWGVRAKFIEDVKVRFSFRRIKRDGKLKSLYKLVAGTVHVLIKGDIKDKIFEYEMGGQIYKYMPKNDGIEKKSDKNQDIVNSMKRYFEKVLSDIKKG